MSVKNIPDHLHNTFTILLYNTYYYSISIVTITFIYDILFYFIYLFIWYEVWTGWELQLLDLKNTAIILYSIAYWQWTLWVILRDLQICRFLEHCQLYNNGELLKCSLEHDK